MTCKRSTLALLAASTLASAAGQAVSATTIIVAEDFAGPAATNLGGTAADTFASGITVAGGSATWSANGVWDADGTVSVAGGSSGASLDLGSYIDDAKGTADGLFTLTVTVSETAGEWISLGFASAETPNINTNFTAANGVATIIYRSADELDMFAGPNTAKGADGPGPAPAVTGARTLSIELDFTPGSGYDGITDFGTVTYSDSILGTLGGGGLELPNVNFGSIYLSEAGNSSGTVSNLTLTQVPEPGSLALLALGGLSMLRRRRV